MVSKGFFPGWFEANEAWFLVCQSWVKITFWNFSPRELMTGIISSPFGTASVPPGKKQFWTSTTNKTEVSDGVNLAHSSLADSNG